MGELLKDGFDYDERWRLLDGLHAVTTALYDQGHARDVYALALTRTRSRQ